MDSLRLGHDDTCGTCEKYEVVQQDVWGFCQHDDILMPQVFPYYHGCPLHCVVQTTEIHEVDTKEIDEWKLADIAKAVINQGPGTFDLDELIERNPCACEAEELKEFKEGKPLKLKDRKDYGTTKSEIIEAFAEEHNLPVIQLGDEGWRHPHSKTDILAKLVAKGDFPMCELNIDQLHERYEALVEAEDGFYLTPSQKDSILVNLRRITLSLENINDILEG
jgi:hypothetical protein